MYKTNNYLTLLSKYGMSQGNKNFIIFKSLWYSTYMLNTDYAHSENTVKRIKKNSHPYFEWSLPRGDRNHIAFLLCHCHQWVISSPVKQLLLKAIWLQLLICVPTWKTKCWDKKINKTSTGFDYVRGLRHSHSGAFTVTTADRFNT